MTNVDTFVRRLKNGDVLEHHGVKGMRWGVRRANRNAASSAPAAKPERKASADYKRVKTVRSKHPSELSNKQLKDLNERLNLEKQFKELTTKVDKKKVDVGHDKVKYILGFATTALTLHQVAKSPLTKDVGKMFAKKPKTPQQGYFFK